MGELTVFFLSTSGSSVQKLSLTSTGGNAASRNVALLFSIPSVACLDFGRLVKAVTSIGMSLTPRERFRGTQSTTLAFVFLSMIFDAFMLSLFMGE